MASTTTSSNETFAFQAEINQLLSLIINTFYSNKDVFLRELISNASDALDKFRYKSLTDSSIDKNDLCIKISSDRDNNVLVIRDFGIGMTKEELVNNLGTIAHSGTRTFMESLANGSADMSLIGQFGVGFYSAFLVADRVKVVSKSANNENGEVWVWESNAGGTFTISSYDGDASDFKVGTEIIMHLKDDQKDYIEEMRIKEIVTKHSQYIGFPIYLNVVRSEEVEVEDENNIDVSEDKDKKEEEEGISEITPADEEDGENKDKKKKTISQTVNKWEHLNKQQPLWTRKPEDVTHEEYAAFYKTLAGDWEDHLAVKHFTAEGQIEFKALLYVPPRAPFDMFNGGSTKKLNNIKLYVRKVLIMDESNELLPEYLSFVKGIVDSDDLPLNVSREMLQQNNIMKLIKKNLVKKIIDMMVDLAENSPDKWRTFYEHFSKNIKLGIMEDSKSKDRLKELLRYHSLSSGENGMISLASYVEKMKEDQKDIYFVTGESMKAVRDMPCLEKLKKRGYDVLLMTDPIDEYMVQQLQEYKDKKLVNCTKEDLVLESPDDMAEIKKEWEAVCASMKEVLGDSVKEVRVSDKLVSKPCVLVGDKYGWSANMERIMKAQALKGADQFMFGRSQKTLEINVDHPIVKAIRKKVEDKVPIKDAVNLLFETVMIDCGYQIENPGTFCSRIYRLINMGLSGEEDGTSENNEENVNDNVPETSNPETMMEEVD